MLLLLPLLFECFNIYHKSGSKRRRCSYCFCLLRLFYLSNTGTRDWLTDRATVYTFFVFQAPSRLFRVWQNTVRKPYANIWSFNPGYTSYVAPHSLPPSGPRLE